MNTRILTTTAIVIATALTSAVSAQSVRVTQIDTGSLLVRGEIDAYVALSGPEESIPEEIDPELFGASERFADGLQPLTIVEVTPDAPKVTGIDFLMLVDNSGSMYETFRDGQTRMYFARQALASFVESVSGSEDRVALGAFNTYLYPLARLGASTGEVRRSLDRITEPDTDAAYTELYAALERFLPELASATGRKAVIVLSDGENYPFSRFSSTTHPVWGDELLSADDVIRRYREEEVTVYAVNFAARRDPDLARIAFETGGAVFEARSSAELSGVYRSIREAIQREIRVRIRVPSATTAERNVTVNYNDGSDERQYFAPLLLRGPAELPWFIPLLVAILAAGGLAALHFLRLESAAEQAQIQAVGTRLTVALQDEVTVIGSAPDAHVSLAGNAGVDHRHATVVRDDRKGTYTLVSERPVRVNNTLVKTRRLKRGDVIGIEGATLVFDAPDEGAGRQ